MKDLARRIRAARAYGRKSQAQMGTVLEMGDKTYKLIELDQREPKRSELLAIAEACEVPMWFLERGWDGWQEESIDRLGRNALRDIEGGHGAGRAAGD